MDWADCCKISQCFQDCREIGEKHYLYGQIDTDGFQALQHLKHAGIAGASSIC